MLISQIFMVKNFFIVVDGMDGSGKSEMVNKLHNYLFTKNKKFRILTTREPTNGIYGSKLREMLKNETNPTDNAKEMLDLFLKDREDHLNNIILPFLQKSNGPEYNIVICDRYYYSTIAFQHTQGIPLELVIEKNKVFKKPDIALFLDIKPEIALDRIKDRAKEKFEQKEFMTELRENFLNLKDLLDDNIIIIDASKNKKEVFDQIKKEIDKLI